MLVTGFNFRTVTPMVNLRRHTLIVVFVAASMSALLGCGPLPVSQVYLSETTYGLYLTLPRDYIALEATDSADTNPDSPPSYLRAFHGPGGSPETLLNGNTPGGYIGMRVVQGDLAAAEEAAANAVLTDLEAAIQAGQAQLLAGPTITEETDSFVSTEWRISAVLPGGTQPSTILQRSTVGLASASGLGQPETHVIKTLVIGCTSECFAAHTTDITRTVDSWRFN